MTRSRMRVPGKGFTLIELLLVLAILAVLAALVVPRFAGRSQEARITAARTDLSTIGGALDTFEVDCGRYPTTDEGLRALMEPPVGVRGWRGPYLKRMPVDPWGQPYQYRYPGMHNRNGYDVFSLGPDGREGNDDIDNWSDL